MKEIRKVYYAQRRYEAKQRLVKTTAAVVLLALSFFLEKFLKMEEND